MSSIVTIYCRVRAVQRGQYTVIVVEDLHRNETDDLKYVTTTLLPNWETQCPQVDDEGFLQFEFVEAGSTWVNRQTLKTEIYKYNANYFISFCHKKDENNVKEFSF